MASVFEAATASEGSAVPLPKAMLVFAHQDDEVIGLGARLGRFGSAHVVHVTDGAPRDGQDSRAHGFRTLDGYRQARAEELQLALRTAGLSDVSCECLGVPDQEASLCLADVTRTILRLMEERRPEVVFTHPCEGGHPDHDACAFAVHSAVAWGKANRGKAPLIVEAAFYHAGPEGIETGQFLPHPHETERATYRLSREEQVRKRRLMECFRTQKDVLQNFGTESESFRVAPEYDFTKPVNGGTVFYESYPWGMSSERFRELAAEAQRVLEEEGMGLCR